MTAYSLGFVRDSHMVLTGLLRLGDCIVVATAAVLAYWLRAETPQLPGLYISATILGTLLTANFMHVARVYDLDNLQRPASELGKVAGAWICVMICLIAVAYFTQTADAFSRGWIVLWFAFSFGGFIVLRAAALLQIDRWQQTGKYGLKVAVVGIGQLARQVARQLRELNNPSVRLVGFFDHAPTPAMSETEIEGRPVLGSVEDLITRVQENHINEIIITVPWQEERRLKEILKQLRNLSVNVRMCPDVFTLYMPVRGLTSVAGIPMLDVFERPLSGWDFVLKSLEDRLLAPILVLLFLPLCILIAIAIRLDTPGPVLFRQRRFGFNNNVIEVMKFRTMSVTQNEGEIAQATRNDPRVTRVGRWLRRTSLDELPQLLNVLRGDMSLVGPRPHAVDHNRRYAAMIDEYLGRHRVKPGITGWAQVNGLRGETQNVEQMRLRVQHDLYYIEHWSLLLDMKILFLTLFVGFWHEKAY